MKEFDQKHKFLLELLQWLSNFFKIQVSYSVFSYQFFTFHLMDD